ncbi:MAG: hypothetical protein ACKOUR_05355 [Planctomycetota bacterium]
MSNATLAFLIVLSTTGQFRLFNRGQQANRAEMESRAERSEVVSRNGMSLAGGSNAVGVMTPAELKRQQDIYQKLWGKPMVVKLDDLPTEGKVDEFRIPYSGHDYPDYNNGTVNALAKYDRAYHRGSSRAAGHEMDDVRQHREVKEKVSTTRANTGGFFRRVATGGTTFATPAWYGHCNGWTAATIRHAEPQNSVVRNGVEFTPADIKGMLAEMYMYTPTAILDGTVDMVNPAGFHLAITNWIGIGKHSIGMESAPGKMVVNFPMYGFKSTIRPINNRVVDVVTIATYMLHVTAEADKSTPNPRELYFHYTLNLDATGKITGGSYQRDSARLDMIWVPLTPTNGGSKGNERGNPHLNTDEVLSIWAESVPAEVRAKWVNVSSRKADGTAVTYPGADEPKNLWVDGNKLEESSVEVSGAGSEATTSTTEAPAGETPASETPANETPAGDRPAANPSRDE